jgi:hypothetical protein
MIRIAFLLAAVIALVAPAQATIDAVTLAQAFRADAADQYKNRQIKGTGVNFHGAINERIADGTTRTSLVMTLGSVREGSAPAILKTVDEFIAAERARTTLVVALSGANLPPPTADGPQTYEFSGIYDGQVRTIMRAGGKILTPPDSGPCKGEQPQGEFEATFYCAPLLVNATATIKP